MAVPFVLEYKELKEYFFDNRKNLYYSNCLEKYNDFLCHSDGKYPETIIERQRPNEPQIVKDFRKQIWQPITKPPFTRVISSLSKIRRSSDWSIKYPIENEKLTKIIDGESLQDYCEYNFPFFDSITNWVFNLLLKQYLIDPNAVICVMPLEINIQETEYLKPFPYLFSCCEVYDFVVNKYAILNVKEGSARYNGGKAFFVINTQSIQKWEQISSKNFDITYEYQHNLGQLPAFKLGGIICSSNGYNFMYESRISGILPNLNESVAEYTDLQAGKRLHIYPERWEFSQHECTNCTGSGVVRNPNYMPGGDGKPNMPCGACNGLGFVPTGPYSKMLLKPVQAGMQQLPMPPAGFIEKDVEIIRIMDESWRKHIFDALAAINFQFLDQTPLNQSGTAKEVDKEELNNTVHAIAEDIVKIMDNLYYLIANYRYRALYPNQEQIESMLPSIAVPEHFDLLSSQFMQEEIGKAKTNKLNPTIVNAMEIEYAGKRFINEPEVKERTELILKLDPLPNITEDEKMSMLSNKGITKMVYIITSNIQSFVQRAVFENKDFAQWDLSDQIEKLEEYAQEQIDQEKAESEAAIKKAQQNMDANQQPEIPDDGEDLMAQPVEETQYA
jgi:hypothetical protein